MQCQSQDITEVCLKLAQLLIKGFSIFCSGDFTQFHSVPGPYELQRNCLNFFSFFSAGGHFVQQSRIMVVNHNGSFRRKYTLPVPFGGTNGAFQRKMVGEGFEEADSHNIAHLS